MPQFCNNSLFTCLYVQKLKLKMVKKCLKMVEKSLAPQKVNGRRKWKGGAKMCLSAHTFGVPPQVC